MNAKVEAFYVGRVVAIYDEGVKVLRTQTSSGRHRRWTELIEHGRLPAKAYMGMRLSARIDGLGIALFALFESSDDVVRTTEGAQCAVS